jgi:hypothetical protein
MIRLENGVYFDLEIAGFSGFLGLEDLKLCEIVESTGLTLPTFKVSFSTYDPRIFLHCNRKNKVKIIMGTDENNFDTFEGSIIEVDKQQFKSTFNCNIGGFLGNANFLTGQKCSSKKGTSLEVLKELGEEYLNGVDDEIEESNDNSMTWINPQKAPRDLMVDTWLHMDLLENKRKGINENTFPLVAVSREGKLLLRRFDKIKKSSDIINFTHLEGLNKSNAVKYLNAFVPEDNTHILNLYNGNVKLTSVQDLVKGNKSVSINRVSTALSTSHTTEDFKPGIKVEEGVLKSDNVHKTYVECYNYNKPKILQLSNIKGVLIVPTYLRDLNLLDLVNIESSDDESSINISGKYITNTIVYSCSATTPFNAHIFVTRDTINNLENHVEKDDAGVIISAKLEEDVITKTRVARFSLSGLRSFIDTSLTTDIQNFLTDLKYNFLNSFSVSGIYVNILDQRHVLESTRSVGRNIFNRLVDSVLPNDVRTLLQSVGWGADVNVVNALYEAVNLYVPQRYSGFFEDLVITFGALLDRLEEVSQNIEGSNTKEYISMLDNTDSTSATKVGRVVKDISYNVRELDIPIPIVELTESQSLLNEIKLKDFVADKTIEELTVKGYLDDIDTYEFKKILLGETLLDTNTASLVNNNVSGYMYTRHWGTFNTLDELTDFYIRKTYKDKFRSPICTKVVNARGDRKIFLAFPSIKKGLKFYINGVETELSSTDIDLRYFDDTNKNIPYTIHQRVIILIVC